MLFDLGYYRYQLFSCIERNNGYFVSRLKSCCDLEIVAQVYAARWEIELLFCELKSQYRLEDLPSRKKNLVEAMVYASVLTLVASRTLLAEKNVRQTSLLKIFPNSDGLSSLEELLSSKSNATIRVSSTKKIQLRSAKN